MKKLLLLIFLVTFSAGAQTYFPASQTWEERSPSSFNMDAEKLEKAISFARDNEYSGSKDLRQAILKGFEHEPFHKIAGPTKDRGGPAGIILKDGYIIAQWGDTRRVDMTFSVTKSFLSTIALLALDQGLISGSEDLVAQYVWDGTFQGAHNSQVSWEHLLQQTSDWSGELWGGHDWADRPPSQGGIDDWKNRELRTPGSVFEYNDVRVNLLAYSLLQVWRRPLPQVLKKEIMDPIGASPTWRWYGYETAWVNIDGVKMQSVTGGGHSGAGMFISTEDMARYGLLFENNGSWNKNQLISEGSIKRALRPSEANPNYGYMWWLNRPGQRHWEERSQDIFYAAGFGGNFIVVDQEKDLVIVTRWLEPSQIEALVNKIYEAL